MNPLWRKLEAAIAELNQLAREPLTEADFAPRFAEIVQRAIAANATLYWLRDDSDRLSLVSLAGTQVTPPSPQLAAETLERACSQSTHQPQTNTDIHLEPIPGEAQAIGVLEVHFAPSVSETLGDAGSMFLASAAQIAGEYHRNQALREVREKLAQHEQLLALSQAAQATNSLAEFAYVTANELRKTIGCERVMVITHRSQRSRIIAVSGVETFDPRSAALRAWQRLAQILGPTGEPLWSSDRNQELPPEVEQAIAEVRETSHTIDYGLFPVVAKINGQATIIGQITFEWFTQPAERETRKRVEEAITLLAPIMLRESIRAANPLAQCGEWWAKQRWHSKWSEATQRGIGVVVAALLLLVIALIPVPFSIEAQGELVPNEQRHIFAPADGIVSELFSSAGEVATNTLLLRLENQPWRLEYDEIRGQFAIIEQELQAAETERLRNSEGTEFARDAASLTARIEQLSVKRNELKTQLRILEMRQSELEVRTPIAGTVITWDWEQQLAGRPVKRGERLCTVADLQGLQHLEIRIPGDAAYYVLTASQQSEQPLPVAFRLGNDPGRRYTGQLEHLAPAAERRESSQPVLRGSVGKLAPKITHARPGTSATVSIACGQRPLGFVWLRPLWELVREYWW